MDKNQIITALQTRNELQKEYYSKMEEAESFKREYKRLSITNIAEEAGVRPSKVSEINTRLRVGDL